MLQLGCIRYQDVDGNADYAVPPNVPIEKAKLLKGKLTLDVSNIDVCISDPLLTLVFNQLLGEDQQMEKREMLVQAAAESIPVDSRPDRPQTLHVGTLDAWIREITAGMAKLKPRDLEKASHRDAIRQCWAHSAEQELLRRWYDCCGLQARAPRPSSA